MAAGGYPLRKTSGWLVEPAREAAEAERLARRAAELAGEDALALCMAGFVLGFVARDLDSGGSLIDRGLQINPNLAWGWLFRGWMKIWLGEPEVALESVQHAMRLNPRNPQIFQMQAATAYAHFYAGRYLEALSWAEEALLVRPSYVTAHRVLAASCAMAGRQEQASKAMARLRQLDPALRLSNLTESNPPRRPEDLDRLAEGLRKAGLPE
jgi:adenylate cyclase